MLNTSSFNKIIFLNLSIVYLHLATFYYYKLYPISHNVGLGKGASLSGLVTNHLLQMVRLVSEAR